MTTSQARPHCEGPTPGGQRRHHFFPISVALIWFHCQVALAHARFMGQGVDLHISGKCPTAALSISEVG